MKKVLIAGVAIFAVIGGSVFVFTEIPTELFASVIQSQNAQRYKNCISSFALPEKTDFTFKEVELNGDGREDVFVIHKDDASCGSAGCVHEICISDNNTFTHIPFGYAAKTIATAQTQTSGMFDLILNNDKKLKMTWDGTRYVLED